MTNEEKFNYCSKIHLNEISYNKKYEMDMKIIAYRGTMDIDVQFSDGAITTTSYQRFKKGVVKHPNFYTKYRLNETRMMNCGLSATVISFNNTHARVTVKFSTGEIRENVTYKRFLEGGVLPNNILNKNKTNRVGETRVQNNGLSATIIEYCGTGDITVQFQDKQIKKTRYGMFKKGAVEHPIISLRSSFIYNNLFCKFAFKTSSDVYYKVRDLHDQFETVLSSSELINYIPVGENGPGLFVPA